MSAYGNPQPYPTVELERSAIKGRIEVARSIIARNGDRPALVASWRRTLDELLDHLTEVETRAASAAIEKEAGR